MDTKCSSTSCPYLRSCLQETDTDIEGEITGEIPRWLKGNLIRIGSGLLQVGSDRYQHVFDGLALMHRFTIRDGVIRYKNRFLRSDAYKRNMKANRIVVSELGTRGMPDPCRTIFQRFSSLFSLDELSDNDLVNVVLYSDEAFACSETNSIWKIDPNTLESLEKVKLHKFLPVETAIAHPHVDRDGTVYNVGSSYGLNCSYNILKFPPKEKKSGSYFPNGSVICKIPSSKWWKLSYHHSFAMTESYFVVVEQPLYICFPRLLWAQFVAGVYADAMSWDEKEWTRFHVISRASNQLLKTSYVSKSFFVFHHINAYEEDNHLVVDMCTYSQGDMIKHFYVKALEEMFQKSDGAVDVMLFTKAQRYVLPLVTGESKNVINCNLVTLPHSKATAIQQNDRSILCEPEMLTESDCWLPELPRINYDDFNGKKYKYFYAMARHKSEPGVYLVKVDTEHKTTISWTEAGVIPSEPVFVKNEDSKDEDSEDEDSEDEDSGVLLASLLYTDDENKVSLVVLDARLMTEIGRVTFHTKASVPADFHGTFIEMK